MTSTTKQNAGIDTFLYGNFEEEHTRWSTFPAEPRYGTNYIGLRNRLSVLSESYAYDSYEDRIRGIVPGRSGNGEDSVRSPVRIP